MKIYILLSSIFVFSLLFLSCSSQVDLLKPEGETVSLEFDKCVKYQGELFAVNDTALVFGHTGKLYEVPLSSVNNMYIHDYSNKKMKKLGSIGAIVYYTIITPLLNQSQTTEMWLCILSLDALAVLSNFIETPKVNFSHPLCEKDMAKLQLYCRYSYGLKSEQWKLLLQNFDQDEFFGLSQLRELLSHGSELKVGDK